MQLLIRALRHIRRHLTREVANTVACSIVGTLIDYCNSFLYGNSEKYLHKLQRVQNKLVRVVMNVGLRDHHTVDLLRAGPQPDHLQNNDVVPSRTSRQSTDIPDGKSESI